MPRKKRSKAPEGAPMWVVSYGDMMSLLLTFFIMLASMANYDDVTEKFMAAIDSIRKALGMTGQVGKQVDTSIDFHSLLARLESVVKPDLPKDQGDSEEEGIYGKNFRLRRIRDGMEITIGGPVVFDLLSAKLTEQGKEAVRQIGETLRGHRNRVEIRGHAADQPKPADWTYEDAMTLSFQRASAVANELILRGVDPRTLILSAAGANEPLARGIYEASKQQQSRRVEIIVRQSLIDDYMGQEPSAVASPVAGLEPGETASNDAQPGGDTAPPDTSPNPSLTAEPPTPDAPPLIEEPAGSEPVVAEAADPASN